MMFAPAPRPPRQSFMDGRPPSSASRSSRAVVINPSTMPYVSSMIFSGARQLVVQLRWNDVEVVGVLVAVDAHDEHRGVAGGAG